ncbi:glycosyltransferase [Halomonas piscis]|uniref:glycosyltransferase n=1 Tax=Halomonas piscis TaxID=3031727 RepID=UPI00289BB0CE|nr:glycosyltransferase [Halomonas piscis]
MDALLHLATQLANQPATPLFAPVQGRVAYVVSHGQSYASNGYAIRTQGIAQALNQHGLEPLCFVRPGRPWEMKASPTAMAPEVAVDGVRYLHSHWAQEQTPASQSEHLEASVDRLIELFRVYRPAAVLAGSDYIVGLPAWVAAKRLGLPFYNEVRGFWELSRDAREPGYASTAAFKAEAERDLFVAQQANKVFTLNRPMQQELVRRGVNSQDVEVVPNGVSTLPQIQPVDIALKRKLGIAENERVVGYLGSFSAYEGLQILIDACAHLVQKGEKLKLLLVGDDQPVTQAAGTHKALADKPWLIQVGRVPHEQVADYYALLDAVVIPRKALPVCELVPPLKAAEALAYGKRLVVSDIAPLKEYAEQHDGVVTFEAENAESLATALQGSLKLPAPKPSTELLFAKHTEPMARALKGEGSAAGQEAAAEAQAKPTEPTQVAAAASAKPVPLAKSQKVAPTKGTLGRRLKAISIMDEISEECWRHEMTVFPINRNNYKEQVAGSLADFCFLESCWKGNRGSWEYAFTSPGLKHANAQALLDLIPRVKKKMPLVFWNKEDPMHYDRYLPIAKSADIIFTTDETKVVDYQRDVPKADVYAVPFAAQQKICNPSDRFRTKAESVCFAGSYYGVGHDERKRQMDALLPSIIEFKGAIYDRMSKIDSDRYKFPPQYEPFIRDAVPFTEVVKLYKRFKVFLNVNTIVESPTMMSRRVYELLACGTPVVSTPSKAIEEQFPGIVHVANDAQEANVIIEKLLTDDHFWEKTSHIGYREVMKKHTYTHRLRDIETSLGYEYDDSEPLVSIITCTRRPNMIDRIVENMTRQNYPNCELILVLQDFTKAHAKELVDKIKAAPSNIRVVKALVNDSSDTLGERFNKAAEIAQGEYIAKMDDDDFYFENYLSDMLIPFTFGDYGLVGKKELYMYLSSSDKLIKRFPGMKHREVDFVAGATFVFKAGVFHKYKFNSLNRGEDSDLINRLKADGVKIYAADPFNFIVWRGDVTAHTWDATDEYFLAGKQTQVVADHLDTSVCNF